MKPVLLFIMKSCPYCREALSLMEELKRENENYRNVEVEIVDENVQPDIADKYDYYYVPTFYIDGVKAHEGAADKDAVRKVFEAALE